jgi:ATP-dependent Zn protease
VAAGLDLGELAGLSFGLTGADVEYFVRGAARRARRRGALIGREDVVAEILRRPRVPGAGRRIGAETLARLAVHEAGHALLQLAGPQAGADIGYVSVAPRSDGLVGFIARLPDERVSLDRADMLHEIAVCLAGRAAEELVYGADGVSDLAADRGPRSDLAVATAQARALRGTSGLAGGSGLLWWPGLPEGLRGELEASTEATLGEAYAAALGILRERRPALERVAAALVRDQEISGAELRRLA